MAGIIVTVINADAAAIDADIETNTEVLGHESVHAVGLEDHMALEESTLRNTGVLNLGLSDHDGLVLQEVVYSQVVDAVVLETGLDNCLFEVTVEAEHLYKSYS